MHRSFCFPVLVGLLIGLLGCGGGGGGGGGGDGGTALSPTGPVVTTPTGTPTGATTLQVTGLDYAEAASLPHEAITIGLVAAALAKQAPTTNAAVRVSIQQSGPSRMIRGSVQTTRDAQGVYVINATNYPGEADYDAAGGDGQQTARIRYVNAAGTNQASPDAGTRLVEFIFTGNTDYGLMKYQNASSTYRLELPAGSTNWLSAAAFQMSAWEDSTFIALGRSFVFRRRGTLTIRSSDGALQGGELNDTLSEGSSAYTARHVVQGGNCVSTYQADGQQRTETNSAALLPDKTMTFSWNGSSSLFGTSGYLTYSFSGRSITYLKCQSDRFNSIYPPMALNGDFGQTVYAKVFQHACTVDESVKGLVDFILRQGGNISNPVSYVIDLVTCGVRYQLDSTTYFEYEYVALPAVGLYFGQGDCEDRAILLGSLLHRLGGDVVMVVLNGANGGQGHACLGLAFPPDVEATIPSGRTYWNYNGKHYYYLECTGPNYVGVPSAVLDNTRLAAVIPPLSTQPTLTATVRALLAIKP